MNRLIIKMRELKEGDCTVVCQHVPDGKIREFKGIYNPRLDMVFMCIAGHYRILGYLQGVRQRFLLFGATYKTKIRICTKKIFLVQILMLKY